MIITPANLNIIFDGFKASFSKGFAGASTSYKDIATVVPSSTREQTYGWLGQFPKMREWLGARVVKNLAAHSYKIVNRDFEQTVSVPRNDIQDDLYGVFGPIMEEMGKSAAETPDELTFALLAAGFSEVCYDDQPFFDTDHPVGTNGGDYPIRSVSNFQGGDGEPWFLLDCTRPLKPMVFQERAPLGALVSKNRPEDDNVFFNKEFIYGSDGRCNVGFGLWQLAYASKEPLTAENYEAARAAMQSLRGDEGRPLGVKPNVLVCGPDLEGAAMRLLNNGSRVVLAGDEDVPVAVQNEWAGTAKPIVTAWLAA
jgi:phage major head subunit gpT-like protein